MGRPDVPGDVTASKYEKHKRLVFKNDSEKSLAGRDIAPLPPVQDTARREAGRLDLRQFCETYHALKFYMGWSPDHLRLIKDIEKAVLHGGLKAIAMPRGSGKTTICAAAEEWAALYGHRQFPVVIGATAPHAKEILASIKMDLETNPLLYEDFPEVCYPIRRLEGIANRCAGQLYDGERTHILWRGGMIRVASLPEDALRAAAVPRDAHGCGAIIAAAGLTGRVRGLRLSLPNGLEVRPDLALVDDPQTKRTAKSETENQTRESLVSADVIGMAGPDKKIACLMPCTVIFPGDMADRMLDRRSHPEWRGERARMMYALPTNTKLWDEYTSARQDELRNDGTGELATEFYRANREAMDEGAKPAWLERFEEGEISAIQHAMNILIRDKYVFWSEYQNEPLLETHGDFEELAPAHVMARVNQRAQGLVPARCEVVTTHVDVQLNSLWYVVMAWEQDGTGYVIDYGCYPDQGRRWFTARDIVNTISHVHPAGGEEAGIYAALKTLISKLCLRRFKVDGGAETRIRQVLVDQGYKTDVVHRFVRESPHAALIMPARGMGITASQKPITEYDRKRGDRIGTHWFVPAVHGSRVLRHVEMDVNFWKSWVHARLATEIGDPGCMTLFGDDPSSHEMFANHLCSEYRVRTEGRGRVVDEWKLPPSKPDNHWFDCVVGCAVAAGMHGVGLPGTHEKKVEKQKIKLSELQRRKRLEREQTDGRRGFGT